MGKRCLHTDFLTGIVLATVLRIIGYLSASRNLDEHIINLFKATTLLYTDWTALYHDLVSRGRTWGATTSEVTLVVKYNSHGRAPLDGISFFCRILLMM